MTFNRRQVVASLGALAASLGAPAIVRADEKTRLVVGTQDIAIQQTVIASGVLEGLPFDLQWAVLPGPAAQLSGLYSKALDVGLMGDTSLIIEQGRAKLDWTEENAPLQIVAGWRNPDKAYPPIVTVVRNDAGIKGIEDLRGRKWAYNFGGFNYLQYVLSRLKAGLKASRHPAGATRRHSCRGGGLQFGAGGSVLRRRRPGARSIEKGDRAHPHLQRRAWHPLAHRVHRPRRRHPRRSEIRRARRLPDARAPPLGLVPGNLATVEQIYREKLKQTPADARYSAANAASRFVPLNAELIGREQRIADVLFESGDIPRKIKVDVEFSQKFNSATNPARLTQPRNTSEP